MKLSIVIVNYNVAYFLEQCLNSVFTSNVDFDIEVFVVDNNSVDNSLSIVYDKFPQVKLIANKKNLGFSKANNQAIRVATGEYILLLNPDTLLETNTLKLCIDFMDSHLDAGGLGVKMVDGKGNFLPESKRGLPTPQAAFYKIFGLSSIFPRSKRFSAYHLGNLDRDEIHEIDVLSGAFMLMRKKTLDTVGLLDEDFFMYGEDIDLSYRILKGGYKNYYFPKTRIIHYKGESTKKDSINYVFVFYKAMIIFARKHFSAKNARTFSFLINMAIIFKASLSLISSFLRKSLIALMDFVVIYAGLFAFAAYWGPNFAHQSDLYPPIFLFLIIPLFILIDLLSVYYNGGYDRPIKLMNIFKGHLFGILIILILYAFMPENFRYSRALVLFAAIYIPLISALWRLLFATFGFKSLTLVNSIRKRFLIIGDQDETQRVIEMLAKTTLQIDSFITLIPNEEEIEKIEEIVKINKINEIIFCAKDISSNQIIDLMTTLQHLNLDFKIAPPESLFIIGSNSINTAGDIYFQDLNSINNAENKRFKRLFDLIISLVLITVFPLTFWVTKKPHKHFYNLFLILFNHASFVSFDSLSASDIHLPLIKKGILFPSDSLIKSEKSLQNVKRINLIYAKEYKISNDFLILFRGLKNLGR